MHASNRAAHVTLTLLSLQNSIRHNLSQSGLFDKSAREEHERGKGGYWSLRAGAEDMFENGVVKQVPRERTASSSRHSVIASARQSRQGTGEGVTTSVPEMTRRVRNSSDDV
jgi:hypothetical protein